MTLAVIDQIADAVVLGLNAAAFSQAITAVAVDMPELDLKTAGVVVQVMTHDYELDLADRGGSIVQGHNVWVLVAKKLTKVDKANRESGAYRTEIREMKRLVEEIAESFLGNRLTDYTSALCLTAKVSPLYDEDELVIKAKFVSPILLGFKV